MTPIISSGLSSLPATTASPASAAAPASTLLPASADDTVDLSSLGRALAALSQTSQSGKTRNDSSGYELPEEVQRLMELIQDLQQQLQEKQQELMRVMSDSSQNQEAKQLKLAEVQASISALTSSLMSAMTELLQMMEAIGEG